ncbi:MAG: DUF2970 domain-containing protein [Granulosicoccus sp.]
MSDNASRVTPFTVIKSALSALIGIQSNENRVRDFESGKFWHFVIAGFIVTAGFITMVWLLVKYLLASA